MKMYVRNQFIDPNRGRRLVAPQMTEVNSALSGHRAAQAPMVERGFYSDSDSDGAKDSSRTKPNNRMVSAPSVLSAQPEKGSVFIGKEIAIDYDSNLDADHRLILSSSLALLKSRNSAVVLAVCSLHFYCGVIGPNSATTVRIAKAMVRVLRSRREIQFAVLTSIKSMVIEAPWMFSDYFQDFFIKSDDPLFNRTLKLDILTALCTKENSVALCKELQAYVKESSNGFVVISVQAVAKVAERNTSLLTTVINGLTTLLTCHRSGDVHSAAAVALRHLLQIGFSISAPGTTTVAANMDYLNEKEDKKRNKKQKRNKRKDSERVEEDHFMRYIRSQCEDVLKQAVRLMFVPENSLTAPIARANLVWLAGEYYHVFHLIAKDLLRLLAVDFKSEEPCTKKEILTLGVKYSMRCPGDAEMEDLMTYVLEMSRYDMSTDVRDLARLMTAMCGLASGDDTGNNLSGGGVVNADALEDLSQRAARIMLATKIPPKIVLNTGNSVSVAAMWNGSDSVSKMLFLIDSISALTGYIVPGYKGLSPWTELQPDPSVRDKVLGSSVDAMDRGYASGALDEKPWLSSNAGKRADDTNFYDDDNQSKDSGKNGRSRKFRERLKDSSSESNTSSSDASDSESNSNSSDSSQRTSHQQSQHGGNRHIMDTRSSSSSDSSSISGSSSGESSDESLPRKAARESRGYKKSTKVAASAADMDAISGGVARRSAVRKVVNSASSVSALPAFGNNGKNVHSDGSLSLLGDIYGPSTAVNANIPLTLQENSAVQMSESPFAGRSGASSNHLSYLTAPYDPDPYTILSPSLPPNNTDSSILAQILDSFPAIQVDAESPTKIMVSPSVPHANALSSIGMSEIKSAPKLLLNPDLSSGLSVTLEFRHGVRTSIIQGTGAKCAILTFKNCGHDYAIRRVKLGFPREIKCTVIDEIPLLAPDALFVVPIEIMTSGLTSTSIKFDVRCDRGTYKGSLALDAWDAITPVGSTVALFEDTRKQLRGFSESLATGCKVSASGSSQRILELAVSKLRHVADMYALPIEDNIARLCGSCVPKSRVGSIKELTVLVTLAIERFVTTFYYFLFVHSYSAASLYSSSPGCISIMVNCDDSVMNSALTTFLKKSLMIL